MTPEIVSAIAAVAAAIIAIFAAVAAFRSARAAELAAKSATLAEHRSMLREILITARSILDETDSIKAIAPQVKSQHAALCNLVGGGREGSSARTLFFESLDERVAPAETARDYAKGFADDYSRLSAASPDDLAKTQARLAADLATLRNLHAELRAQLSDLSQQRRHWVEQLAARRNAGG